MNWTLILSIFQGTITSGTSILLATLGGIVCGRVGSTTWASKASC